MALIDRPDAALLAESRGICEAALADLGSDGDPAARASVKLSFFSLTTPGQ